MKAKNSSLRSRNPDIESNTVYSILLIYVSRPGQLYCGVPLRMTYFIVCNTKRDISSSKTYDSQHQTICCLYITPCISESYTESGEAYKQHLFLSRRKTIKKIVCYIHRVRSRDSVVGIVTGYGLDDRGVGVRVPVGSRIFSSPRRPDRLWSSPSLLSSGYGGKLAGARS
jgi:hypothetical protein